MVTKSSLSVNEPEETAYNLLNINLASMFPLATNSFSPTNPFFASLGLSSCFRTSGTDNVLFETFCCPSSVVSTFSTTFASWSVPTFGIKTTRQTTSTITAATIPPIIEIFFISKELSERPIEKLSSAALNSAAV